jgi:hypothetical protein
MKHQEIIKEIKDLAYYKTNAEEDYLKVPISVLRYISELEQDKKMYSEEEVVQLLQKALTHQDDGEIGSLVTAQKEIRTANFYSWFNKFKNK